MNNFNIIISTFDLWNYTSLLNNEKYIYLYLSLIINEELNFEQPELRA